MADKRVTEALDLAKNANKSGLSRDKINKVIIGPYNTIVKIPGEMISMKIEKIMIF